MSYFRFDMPLQPPVVEPRTHPWATHKPVATDKPCVVCTKPIQPGQLYVKGPRHIGC